MNKYFATGQNTGKQFCSCKTFPFLKRLILPLIASFVGIFFSVSANAQDKIIRKDGKEIQAKVLGTDSKYIRYKRFNNPTGPDYFIFRSEVSKIEYENAGAAEKGEPLKLGREQSKNEPIADLRTLESRVLKHKKRSTIYLVAGSVAVVAGAATFIKLGADYTTYKNEIRKTNDAYTTWYRANYEGLPPAGDLQKKEGFVTFASPGFYAGAAAVLGGIALELAGLKNIQIARKTRNQLTEKKKELSLQPFYEPSRKAAGLSIALSF